MKKISILLIAVGLTLGAVAQEAEYTLLRHTYSHNADGSIDVRHRKELKLLRNRIFTAYTTGDGVGETFILYNPAFMQLTINEAYTLLPDGKKVMTPENAFVDQLPKACSGCGRYSGLRERVVIHTALEVDATIVLDYTLHINSQSGYFSDVVNLRESHPIKRLEIHGFDGKDTLLTDIAARSLESSQPKATGETYTVSYGTKPVYPVMKSVPEATEMLQQMQQRDALEYAQAICQWVTNYISTQEPIDEVLTDYQIAPAAEVYASGCGTPWDKCGLLCALLNQAGFEAQWKNTSKNNTPMLVVKIDGIEYNMAPKAGFEVRPVGAAREENNYVENNIDSEIEWAPMTLAEGFGQLTLPKEYLQTRNEMLNVLQYTSRKTPLKVKQRNVSFHYTLTVPKGARLLGGDIVRQQQVEGIGNVQVSITQKKRKVEIDIRIEVKNSIIEPKQYDSYRSMATLLTPIETLTFQY